MPEAIFIDMVNKYKNNDTNTCATKEISEYFCVSNQAVISRGKFLGIFVLN